jgi:hypothetical protein
MFLSQVSYAMAALDRGKSDFNWGLQGLRWVPFAAASCWAVAVRDVLSAEISSGFGSRSTAIQARGLIPGFYPPFMRTTH